MMSIMVLLVVTMYISPFSKKRKKIFCKEDFYVYFASLNNSTAGGIIKREILFIEDILDCAADSIFLVHQKYQDLPNPGYLPFS